VTAEPRYGCSVRVFLDASGRMHAASVVVRCPLTPYDSEPPEIIACAPHRVGWDHHPSAIGPRAVALPPQE
jgi:hypothetical protein